MLVPVVGSQSRCAGLPQSNETVSTLPFIRIFMTLPLLATTLYGPRKGRSEAAQLLFVTRIHVCMFLFPCTGKC